MIKRTYFISATRNWGEGNGSYSHHNTTCTYTSWFPDPEKVLEDASSKFKSILKGSANVEILAFNRV